MGLGSPLEVRQMQTSGGAHGKGQRRQRGNRHDALQGAWVIGPTQPVHGRAYSDNKAKRLREGSGS